MELPGCCAGRCPCHAAAMALSGGADCRFCGPMEAELGSECLHESLVNLLVGFDSVYIARCPDCDIVLEGDDLHTWLSKAQRI